MESPLASVPKAKRPARAVTPDGLQSEGGVVTERVRYDAALHKLEIAGYHQPITIWVIALGACGLADFEKAFYIGRCCNGLTN
jgi:hypothetical protein